MFWKRIPGRWTGIKKGIRNIHHGSAVMALDFNLADLGSVLAGTQMRKDNGQRPELHPHTQYIPLYSWACLSLRNERVYDIERPGSKYTPVV